MSLLKNECYKNCMQPLRYEVSKQSFLWRRNSYVMSNKRTQEKEKSTLKTLIDDKNSGYTINSIHDVQLVLKDGDIYIPEPMREERSIGIIIT